AGQFFPHELSDFCSEFNGHACTIILTGKFYNSCLFAPARAMRDHRTNVVERTQMRIHNRSKSCAQPRNSSNTAYSVVAAKEGSPNKLLRRIMHSAHSPGPPQ